MKAKAKKRCRKHKYKHTMIMRFGTGYYQVPYKNQKQLEFTDKCVQRILREVEADEKEN